MAHAATCPSCHYVFPPISEAAPLYFEHGQIACKQCGTNADLWDEARARVTAEPAFALCLVSLGVVETHFDRVIEANKYLEVDLTEVGVPKDATVLQAGYTSQGSQGQGMVIAHEVHGNVPTRRIADNILRLMGVAATMGDGTIGTASRVNIWVSWVPHTDDASRSYLVGAFDAFTYKHYDRVIVPAQSAAEISITPIIRELLEHHASNRLVERFMNDRLSFGNIVNIVLPFMCGQAKVPPLPDKIRGALNTLRDTRNTLVHSGISSDKVTSRQAGEGLCAAVFSCEYARFVHPKLRAWLT